MIHAFECADLIERILIIALVLWTIVGFGVAIIFIYQMIVGERPATYGKLILSLLPYLFLLVFLVPLGPILLISLGIRHIYDVLFANFFNRPIEWKSEPNEEPVWWK